MANNYKRWLCEESLKTPSSRPILIYFEFRSKPSLITVICMDPHSPNKLIATEYCSLILGDDYRFLFLYFFFVIINFYKNCFIIVILFYYYYFFMKIIFILSCSGMFWHVPECSVFRGLPTGHPGSVIVPQYRSNKMTVFVWGKNTILKFLGNT